MAIYHLSGNTAFETGVISNSEKSSGDKSRTISANNELEPTRIALDGREMKLIRNPAKNLIFYSDSNLVTFHHYVEFLNEASGSLSVTDSVVKQNEDIWVYSGDGSAESDQIIFQNSRFYLRRAQWAPKPVTRVTWLGAKAYARHYGKQLPTYDKFLILKQNIPITPNLSQEKSTDTMHSHMQSDESSQNSSQIQGGKTVTKEWVSEKKPDSSSDSHVAKWFVEGTKQSLTKRYPWEGFYDVGFRTVLDGRSISIQHSNQP